MSIEVITAERLLAACKSDASKVLLVEKKKETKEYTGTTFLNAKYNVDTSIRKEGWFSFKDVPIRGMADGVTQSDLRNKYKATRMQMESNVSKAGAIGEALNLLNPVWLDLAKPLAKNGRRIHGLLQTHISADNKDEKLAGQPLEDPTVRFQVCLDPYPEKYPLKFLVGKPQTVIHDYTKPYVDEKGVTQYALATVTNENGEEEPLTEKNIHLFVTKGSVIRIGRIYMPSVAISGSWVSLPITISKAVIEPGGPEGFSDEAESQPSGNLAAVLGVKSQPTAENSVGETQQPGPTTTEGATENQTNETAPIDPQPSDKEAVDALMNAMGNL